MTSAWRGSSVLLLCSTLLLACHHGPDTVDGDTDADLRIEPQDGGIRDADVHRDAAEHDLLMPHDSGTDGPPAIDLGGTDLATSADMTSHADMTIPADMTTPVDMVMPADMSSPADMTASLDMTSPIDMVMHTDMSGPADMTTHADMTSPGDMAGMPTRLRVMSANTTTGNYQSYDPGEGIRIFQGLHPDVAMIQEFNYGDNSDSVIRGFIDTTFGTTYSYYRESGAQIPNGIASRYPIVSSGNWIDPAVSNRSFAWARIDVPGPKDLWAISIHLLTSSATNRNTEATALIAEINKAIPTTDYLVIGGDLNTGTRTEACLTTFSARVSVASPYPVDNLGNANTSGSRSKPHDWVMPSANLRSLETGVLIGAQTFTNGLVVDSRVYMPLSDISPVNAGDSGATNMQHMAVVEDFLLP